MTPGSPVASWWRTLHRFRVVLWCLGALGALDLIVAVNADRWETYDLNPYRERLNRCRQGAWDVLVAGGSPAMCGIDPTKLIGAHWNGRPIRSAYNLGLPLATTSEVCLAVEHAVASPPQLLVYAVSATDLNDARFEPQGPRTLMTPADVVCWARLRPRDLEWCVRHFGGECVSRLWQLYRHRNGIRLWAADAADGILPGLCPDAATEARLKARVVGELRTGVGYRAEPAETPHTRLDLRKAIGEPCDRLPFLEPYRLAGGHVKYLERLLDWAAERRVAVLLVDLPVPADLDERLYQREYAMYRALLRDVAGRRGVEVLTARRDELGLTDADFSDLIHLNAAGAARLSAWLRRAIDNPRTFAAATGESR